LLPLLWPLAARKKKWLLLLRLPLPLLKLLKTLAPLPPLLVLQLLLVLLPLPLMALLPPLVLLLKPPKVLLTPPALLLLKPPRRLLKLLLPLSRSLNTPAFSCVSESHRKVAFSISKRYPVGAKYRVSNANIIHFATQCEAQRGACKVRVIVLQTQVSCNNRFQVLMRYRLRDFCCLLV